MVCPIESILYQDELLHIPHKTGDDALAIALYDSLHDIQVLVVIHGGGVWGFF